MYRGSIPSTCTVYALFVISCFVSERALGYSTIPTSSLNRLAHERTKDNLFARVKQ